ncbi:hypothetical protein BB559_002599 [Furculomyces boomerangus]|uniref:ABC transporter domain-containing protein n=2 Tax=Harpellales TaxID=61421 RepID=A0A2T9YU12_9FUNG|nr:hypothetical protein BB559_002599 [Furculomyces boomerangus]PWA01953.1 hypothetical protein BB558_001919 [Smittium angustum]
MLPGQGIFDHAIKKINYSTRTFLRNFQLQQLKSLNWLLWKYLNNKDKFNKGALILTIFFSFRQYQKLVRGQKGSPGPKKSKFPSKTQGQPSNSSEKPEKVGINKEFLKNIKKIIKIIVPGIRSKEFLTITVHSVLLVFRTVLSVYFASLDGEIVSSMVRLRFKEFLFGIMKWMLAAVPAAMTNSGLEYLQNLMSTQFRKRLTSRIHDLYLKDQNFYALSNLDSRIHNADQIIVVDVQKFCHSIAILYSNLVKPSLDFVVYNYMLAQRVGIQTLFIISSCIQLSTGLLRALTPPFGALVAEEQKLEGELHHAHSRIIENAEEIALWNGHKFELKVVQKKYKNLIKHVNRVFRLHVFYGMVEDFIIKYFWGAAGLIACAAPVFSERLPSIEEMRANKLAGKLILLKSRGSIPESALGARTKQFVTTRRLLLSGSDAMGRIIYLYKEIVQLSGFTQRVADLLNVLEDISNNKFVKTQITESKDDKKTNTDLLKERGKVVESENIVFKKVPILSPTGDVLIRELSFAVLPGMNLLVLGPNGCGKSSMFRILGGLWPVYGGILERPSPEKIFYLPQRPYMCSGTLRDQIIYPHTVFDLESNGVSDSDLADILEIVQLNSLVTREGGWDTVKEWRDSLSGGDKQRIAMARLFYHKPKFAIMDECTSAVSMDIERIMYSHAAKLGITMLTVSHRQSLWKYHNYLLEFDGQGNYLFTKFDPEERLSLLKEKQKLEQQSNLYEVLEEKLG